MKTKNEKGAVMLESTYCILISIIVIMFFMSFGFFLYQKTIVSIVANDIAEEIAQTYKLRNVEDDGMVLVTDISGIGKYRYFLFSDSFNSKNEIKGRNLGNVRLSKTSLAKKVGDLSVDVETVVDDIGRRHYEVTVKQRYSFLMGDLLELVGLEGIQTLEEKVYVESVDVLNYVNTVKTTKYGINEMKENSAALGLIDNVISLVQAIFDE